MKSDRIGSPRQTTSTSPADPLPRVPEIAEPSRTQALESSPNTGVKIRGR